MNKVYKHKIVQGLAALIDKFGGGGKDPMMRALFFGIKGQLPNLLQSLDENEEAIAEIERRLREVLDVPPEPIPQITEEVPIGEAEAPEEEESKPKGKKKSRKGKPSPETV